MRHAIKIGLVVGLISLILTFCISAFSGLFSLVSPFLTGGFAGYFAAGKAFSKVQGTGYGAFAGAIAGGIAVHADLVSGMVLAFAQYSQMKSAYGAYGIAINPFGLPSDFFTVYILTVLPAIGFGAIAGATAGFLGAKDAPSAIVN
jgi:hypothetical protein